MQQREWAISERLSELADIFNAILEMDKSGDGTTGTITNAVPGATSATGVGEVSHPQRRRNPRMSTRVHVWSLPEIQSRSSDL